MGLMSPPWIRCLAIGLACSSAWAQGFHQRAPNLYRQTADDNAVTALAGRLAAGEVDLPAAGPSGRLRALLQQLEIPEASQLLVFSKTSLQRHRISPHNPRALYFGREAYVGWVPGAQALEVAAADARLGMVFYTLNQAPDEPPRLTRDDSCLRCHASGFTDDEPGLILRSVFPDENGDPIASAGEEAVTLATPMADRWGGWIVTGAFAGEHRGNGIAERDEAERWVVRGRRAVDLAAFAPEFDPAVYLAPTSDVGALLAFEQQATVHNLLIRAALQMRCLQETDRALNAMLGEDGEREQTAHIAERLAKEIASCLLMGGEASLAERAAAASPAFAAAYPGLWPAGPDGTRLGALDLKARVFALPVSPMVHATAFAALPDALRKRVLERLRRALGGRLPAGVTVTREQRAAIDAHLRATLPGYAE